MKIVTATELFLRDRTDEKQKAFKTLITIIKLENDHFTDDDWAIYSGELVIDIDESYFTINNYPLADWLNRIAHVHSDNDKHLTVESFK